MELRDASDPGQSARFRAHEVDRHIGQRLRFVRRLSGWSQRELGGLIGMTFQQVQKYENGANRVSAGLLAELAGLFRLPLDWFVGPYAGLLEPAGGAGGAGWEGAGWEGAVGPGGAYAALLDMLFRHDGMEAEGARGEALATICQLMRVGDPRGDRLGALRAAIGASGPADRAFMLEAARRMMEQGAVVPVPARTVEAAGGVAAPGSAGTGQEKGSAGHVLLVDDDPDIVATLSASLASAGFAVTSAPGGDKALALLAADLAADVLVTDYAMVGMDGVELLAQAALLRPMLPGLVITGFADSERLRDLPAGVEVLRKPFRRMELIGRLRLLVPRSPSLRAPNSRSPSVRSER